jgi:hypothetical protein
MTTRLSERPARVSANFLKHEELGEPLRASAEPLTNPWAGRMDGALAHELGFRPTVPTIHAAARDGIL